MPEYSNLESSFPGKVFSRKSFENWFTFLFLSFRLLNLKTITERRYFALFVYQNLRTGIYLIVSLVHYFISRIRNLPTKPTSCIDCCSTFLKDDAVLATTGMSEKNADYVPSVLCLSCETLMIITPNPGPVVGINHSVGNQVTVRNS